MYYITTAIDYTNGPPHIGHAYEKVLADVLARWHRMKGEEVYFLTGVDQHGQKVQQTAEKLGITPQEHVDNITARFLALWERLGISYDGWAATTDPRHKACVQKILTSLKDKGQLYKNPTGAFIPSGRNSSLRTRNGMKTAISARNGGKWWNWRKKTGISAWPTRRNG